MQGNKANKIRKHLHQMLSYLVLLSVIKIQRINADLGFSAMRSNFIRMASIATL